ncbi:carboxypeptidase-like regulatory domain-containing protein [Niabella insulamsoli]|uniref:carboxypeptidase-like regulatory domain-containing protein n=1 Tax=Niabella insulamsoli TaxID=3144874 RepID=UPI0031FDDE40
MQHNNTYPFYGPEDIKRYLSGSMSAQEMHDIEKAALKDPLLADAIDGFRKADPAVADKHLNEIKSAILGTTEKEHPVISLPERRNRGWRLLTAACSIGLIAGSVWWFTQRTPETSPKQPIAAVQPTEKSPTPALPEIVKTEVTPAPEAAVTAPSDAKPQRRRAKPKSVEAVVKPPTEPQPTIAAQAPAAVADNNVAAQLSLKNPLTLRQKRYDRSNLAFPQGAQALSSRLISGKVTDKEGKPLEHATISVKPNQAAVANSEGKFALSAAADSNLKAVVSLAGYQQTVATLSNARTNNIQLEREQTRLDEPVIVGYGAPKKERNKLGDFRKFREQTTQAKNEVIYPEEGWKAFYQDLSSNLGVDQSKATKTLQIKFTVDDNGDPVDFTIVESPDEILTRKAIEFIKKSKWKNFKLDKNALVKIEVN